MDRRPRPRGGRPLPPELHLRRQPARPLAGRFKPAELDDKGLYLFARSTALLGDLQRDQGAVLGPLSAQHSYVGARSAFTQLDIPRRIA